MFKNIMLPVDGSHFSELALPLAVQIARKSAARLHIVRVHVSGVQTAEAVISENYEELVRDWERDALSAARARATELGVDTTAELLEGPIVDGLQRFISAAGIDLVVMTTHGRGGIRRAVMGSVAEQCVRRTEVPILMIHPRSERDEVTTSVRELKRILVPLDGSAESEAVLPHAVRLAQLAGAEIVLTRVATAPFDIAITIGVEALKDYLDRLRHQAETYLIAVKQTLPKDLPVTYIARGAERAPQAIVDIAESQKADLIAMATHGRTGWARVAIGSVAESVLHKSATPVLLIKGITERASTDLHSEQNEPAHSGG